MPDMEEEFVYRLAPGALDTIEENFETLDPEMQILLRAVQSGAYMERDFTESELERLLLWYHRHLADQTILDLFLKGEIFWAGFEDPETFNSVWTLSPQGRSRFEDDMPLLDAPSDSVRDEDGKLLPYYGDPGDEHHPR